jgi:tetratricopeptide (TPR) repeat protein
MERVMMAYRMMGHSLVVCFVLAASASAQLQVEAQSSTSSQHVHVTVSFANGACDPSTHVSLSGRGGIVAEADVNERCVADLTSVPSGTYRVIVSGHGARVDTEGVVVDSSGMQEVEVKVRNAPQSNQAQGSAAPMVAASDLHIPAAARKELARAIELMTKENWQKAIEKLNRSIAIDPNYAEAYNNLGVVYGHLGDRGQESIALQKAIGIDDHCAPAYVNLARLSITANDFAQAETLLNKASASDPKDATTLVLLSYVEFTNHHFDNVIATARKAHSLHGNHAFVHWMAARALAQQQARSPERDAAREAELKLFLQEEPDGARAEKARQQLAVLKDAPREARRTAPSSAAQ